jgi:RNA polymerase sigma-B factor
MSRQTAFPNPPISRSALRALPSSHESRTAADLRLFVRYHEHGDLRARDELCERFMPLARQLARRYDHGSGSFEDLLQVASLALVKAIDRFDFDRGLAFSSYAVPTILGELRRYFRDTSWAVHVPRGTQERIAQVTEATQRLSRELGTSPTPSQIAEDLGLSPEEVIDALEAATAQSTVPLDAPSGPDAEDRPLLDSMGAEDESYEMVGDLDAIAPGVRGLTERDRLILQLRFGEDLTQAEIAERIGISQMHVSRLLRRSIDRLRMVADAA